MSAGSTGEAASDGRVDMVGGTLGGGVGAAASSGDEVVEGGGAGGSAGSTGATADFARASRSSCHSPCREEGTTSGADVDWLTNWPGAGLV
jgi:hypothetical protein